MNPDAAIICKECKQSGTGKYCSKCGVPLVVKKISMANLFHEVFHFFTHLDKGIAFTLKQLFKSPGGMQRNYVEGHRSRHQKPFSFFFLTATLTGVSLYYINVLVKSLYGDADMAEGAFFHEYMIFLLLFSLPFITFLTWIMFYRSTYNFAEIGVLILYTLPVIFFIVVLANCIRLIFPDFETRLLELPLILLYCIITNVNFFQNVDRWKVVLKTVVVTVIFYLTVAYIQDRVVEMYFSSGS